MNKPILSEEAIDALYSRDLRRASDTFDALIRQAWNDRAERVEQAEKQAVLDKCALGPGPIMLIEDAEGPWR